MDLIQNVLAVIVVLGLLVTFHEFGHFWVARRCGVKVLRFSVGFGKPIWSRFDRHGTEFALAAIPLGGYVKMLDEREGHVDPSQLDQAFNRKSVWARIAIVAAGPLANFLLALGRLLGIVRCRYHHRGAGSGAGRARFTNLRGRSAAGSGDYGGPGAVGTFLG